MNRAEKYKNIIEETEKTKEIKKIKEEPKKEDKKVEEEYFTDLMDKKEIKKVKEEQSDNKKETQEDIFITKSFKPFTIKEKTKNIIKPLLISIIIIITITSITYFYLVPLAKKYLFIKPIDVYNTTIDKITNELLNTKLYSDNKTSNTYYLNIESNDKYKELNDYYIEYTNNYEIDNNKSYKEFILSDNKEQNKYYITDNKYITIDDNIYEINDYIEENIININDTYINQEDYEYLINKINEILKQTVIEERLTKSKDKLNINNNKINVNRYSYNLDYEAINTIRKEIINKINADQKTIDILSKQINKTSVETKKYIEDILSKEIDKDYNINFNLYIKGIDEVIGFDIEIMGFRKIYLYNYQKDIEMYLKIKDYNIELNGTKENNNSSLTMKINNIDSGTINIYYELNKLNIDYNYNYNKTNYNGLIEYDNKLVNIKLNNLIDDKKNNIVFKYTQTKTYKENYIEQDLIKEYNKKQYDKDAENITNIIKLYKK